MPINPKNGEWDVRCIQPELKEPLTMETWDTEEEAQAARAHFEKVNPFSFKWIVERRIS